MRMKIGFMSLIGISLIVSVLLQIIYYYTTGAEIIKIYSVHLTVVIGFMAVYKKLSIDDTMFSIPISKIWIKRYVWAFITVSIISLIYVWIDEINLFLSGFIL